MYDFQQSFLFWPKYFNLPWFIFTEMLATLLDESPKCSEMFSGLIKINCYRYPGILKLVFIYKKRNR